MSAKPLYTLRQPEDGDMQWVVQSEGALYGREWGFDETFEALVATIVSDFVENFDPARERCWIAEAGKVRMGHVFLVKHPDQADTAKLRLLLVEPEARGLGLGQALVAECVQFARAAGYRRITLWTQSVLVGACRIYQKAGFRMVKEQAHHSFGCHLMGQTWELELYGSNADFRS